MRSLRFYLILTFMAIVIGGCLESIEEVPLELPVQKLSAPRGLRGVAEDEKITLCWRGVEGAYSYRIYRLEESGSNWKRLAEVEDTLFVDSGLINGRVYFYAVSAVSQEGIEFERSEAIGIRPSVYSIIINDGDRVTNRIDVEISISAPASTEFMIFSNDSTFAGGKVWENFAYSKNWRLEGDDGIKRVFAKFMDESGAISPVVSSSIKLDRYASISQLSLQPGTLDVGGVIHFTLETDGSEKGGSAWIEVENFSEKILLFDNGKGGDTSENDGTYEVDYRFPKDVRGIDLSVRGYFIDEAGNQALPLEAQTGIYFTDSPDPVTLLGAIDSTTNSITIKWEQSNEENFRSYRIYRKDSPGVDESPKYLIKELNNVYQTTYPDGDLEEGKTYYYRIFVVNDLLETAGSNEVALSTYDAYPTPVVLDSVSAVGPDRLTLTWSRNNDTDFKEYRVYRSTSPGVTESSDLIATIDEREVTYYDDTGINTSTTIYYYRIFVYDRGGKFSRSNEVSSR